MSVALLGSARSSLSSQSLCSKAIFVTIRRGYASSTKHPAPKRFRPIKGAANLPQKITLPPSKEPAVNPPASTLPPLLDLVERRPDQSATSYYIYIGKSYINFYRTALRAVWVNSKEARAAISARKFRGRPPYIDELRTGLLTRAEFQFIARTSKDFWKLPLVGILVTLCGEFTPLLVVFVSGIIPRAAWIPKQVHRARVNTEKRREESFRQGTIENDIELKRISAQDGVEGLSPAQILHISRALGLHSTLWEKLWDRPPQWIARMKARRALDYLQADDFGIHRDGGVQALSDVEIERACEERGFDVLKYDIKTLRSRLELYMKFRMEKKISTAAMVLVRPSSWEKLV